MIPPADVPAMRSKQSRIDTPRSCSRYAKTFAVNRAFTPPPSRARIWNGLIRTPARLLSSLVSHCVASFNELLCKRLHHG